MAENKKDNLYNDDDRQYLEMMQGNIERMATNSSNCKAWMVTIVAAVMALQCSIDALNGWILLGIFPVVLFWYLDVFYLHLERGMRNRETVFLNMLRSGQMEGYEEALFNFKPLMIGKKKLTDEQKEQGLVATDDRWFTESVIPFYGLTLACVMIISVVLNWDVITGWIGKFFS